MPYCDGDIFMLSIIRILHSLEKLEAISRVSQCDRMPS